MSDQPCSVCGGQSFHRVGCPVLEPYLWGTAAVLGSITAWQTIVTLTGGHHGDLRPAYALTLLFAVLIVVSRVRRFRYRRGDGGSVTAPTAAHTVEGRWIAFLRGPWIVAGPGVTIGVFVLLLATLGIGVATFLALCAAAVGAVALVAWRRSIKRRKAAGTWPYG